MRDRIASKIDELAGKFESKGLFAEAEALDVVANTLEAAVSKPTLKAVDPRRGRINKELAKISKEYRPEIPLDEIFKALEKNGLCAIDKDGTKWEGFLTGKDGRATIDVAFLDEEPENGKRAPIENAKLVITWYKMPSGKYETLTYLGY